MNVGALKQMIRDIPNDSEIVVRMNAAGPRYHTLGLMTETEESPDRKHSLLVVDAYTSRTQLGRSLGELGLALGRLFGDTRALVRSPLVRGERKGHYAR